MAAIWAPAVMIFEQLLASLVRGSVISQYTGMKRPTDESNRHWHGYIGGITGGVQATARLMSQLQLLLADIPVVRQQKWRWRVSGNYCRLAAGLTSARFEYEHVSG